jgi:hypothetical protein
MHGAKSSLPDLGMLRLEIMQLRRSVAELKAFNACSREFLKTAATLSADAKARPPAAGKPAHPRPAPAALRLKPLAARCSALAAAYLRFKVVEALQPHPAYANDDGFQPLGVIVSLNFTGDRKARKVREEFMAAKLSLLDVVEDLINEGIVVKTAYEPRNGDAMVGLVENLPKREAADRERTRLVADLASKYGLYPRWNRDGTGSLETLSGDIVQPTGCIWTLLSSLYDINEGMSNRKGLLN